MLYVSISKLSLSNLTGTTFTRRSLSAGEASALIAQARRDGSLTGVSSHDLAAPYEKGSLDLHREVCDTLRTCGVELLIKDFFNERFCNALEFARVQAEHRLLVIELGFDVNLSTTSAGALPAPLERVEAHAAARVAKLFTVSPKAFKFHLFEEVAR